MEFFRGFTAMIVMLVWLAGSVLSRVLGGWWGLAVYIIGSTAYAVWCRLLERSMK